MTVFYAPARYPLGDLHVPAPVRDSGEPVTVCGVPMREDESWMPVDRRPGDRICASCEAGTELEPEPSLW